MRPDLLPQTSHACGAKPPCVPSRLLAAVHRLDDLLGAPESWSGYDLIDWLQHEQAAMRWLSTCLRRLDHAIASQRTRSDLARILCLSIVVTTRGEAQLLMPALRRAGAPAATLDEVEVSDECLRTMARRLRRMVADQPQFGARAAMLGRLADWHATLMDEAVYPLGRRLIDGKTLSMLGARFADLREGLHLAVPNDDLQASAVDEVDSPRDPPR